MNIQINLIKILLIVIIINKIMLRQKILFDDPSCLTLVPCFVQDLSLLSFALTLTIPRNYYVYLMWNMVFVYYWIFFTRLYLLPILSLPCSQSLNFLIHLFSFSYRYEFRILRSKCSRFKNQIT